MSVSTVLKERMTVLNKKTWFGVLLALLFLLIGFGAGWLIAIRTTQKAFVMTSIHDPESGYHFINPTLYSEIPESLSYPTYTPLQNALQSYISTAEAENKIRGIGVYYQDLNSHNWVGVNQSQQFDPASMLKVTTLIALLRAEEIQPKILSVKISIPASVVLPTSGVQDYYPPGDPVQSGATYTIADLTQRLITQSDNGADAVLVQYLGNTSMATVFSDLGIPQPGTSVGVSPQQYSHIFRVLYNGTYLSSPDSEQALQLLSETNFTAGLVAGVPAGTVVSHKFGESMDPTGETTGPATEPGLSDCGIVYYPDRPYFLCVMTKGYDFKTLAGVIKDVSNITWQQVDTLATTKS